jgi:uncharacterized protein
VARSSRVIPIAQADVLATYPLTPAFLIADYSHTVALSRTESLAFNLLTGKSWRGNTEDLGLGRTYVEESKGGEPAAPVLARYQEISKQRSDDRISIVLVPTYSCNFACGYCYEGKMTKEMPAWTIADVDGVVSVCRKLAALEGTDLSEVDFTVLGGEPIQDRLLDTLHRLIGALAREGAQRFAIVTNGSNLPGNVASLRKIGVTEIMITIDGPREIHEVRRISKEKGVSTFDLAIQGVRDCLANDLNVVVRVNIDQTNVTSLPSLAKVFEKEGFFEEELFSSYLYPVSHDTRGGRYATEAEIARMLESVALENPSILKFRWELHGLSFLYQLKAAGKPQPKFRYCGATSRQFTVDVKGGLYTCWFGAGRPEFSVGAVDTVSGEFELDHDHLNRFRSRGPLEMATCKNCKWALICGGGCTYKAVQKTGAIESPNCAPFPEIMEACGALVFSEYDAVPTSN